VSSQENPLLSEDFRIPFRRIEPRHVEPGVREVLATGADRIEAIAAEQAPPTWDNLMAPLEEATRWVSERIAPAGHLMAVAETKELREAYNAVLPELSGFWTRIALDARLWERLERYAGTDEARALEGVRARHLEKTLREFRRAGADLPAEKKARLETLKVELAQLEQRFGENVLDATAAYELLVTDRSRLEGVPESTLTRYAARAREQERKGWLLTLDFPSVEPILKYCRDRELRKEIFSAFIMRCRDGEWDNRGLIVQILALRDELARLLGYPNFPDYRLEEHMVRSGERALAFAAEMVERTRPYWERDARALGAHARSMGLDALRPWDVAFVSEALRLQEYDLDDEMLRPYFPLDQVMEGLFEIVRRVFGLDVREAPNDEVWHPDVRFYEITDEDGTRLGSFYTDWYPRKAKRQGAWMNDFRTGGPRPDGGFDPHLGVVCGNFTPPDEGGTGGVGASAGGTGALLTHREVETIFHEFGHLLHHTTSRVPVRARGGLNVAWDWVELPSQLMENWCWEREALDLFARHHETGEPIPEDLFERLTAAKRFMSGWAQMRQLSFGSVDLELHGELAPTASELDEDRLMEYARERFGRFAPQPEFADYHVLTSFTHLFAGGYAASYYSYLWSEVLDADAFTRFRENGIFDRSTGRSYMDTILTRGDSADPDVLFQEFMGREPDPAALLERNLGPSPLSPMAGRS